MLHCTFYYRMLTIIKIRLIINIQNTVKYYAEYLDLDSMKNYVLFPDIASGLHFQSVLDKLLQ